MPDDQPAPLFIMNRFGAFAVVVFQFGCDPFGSRQSYTITDLGALSVAVAAKEGNKQLLSSGRTAGNGESYTLRYCRGVQRIRLQTPAVDVR